MSGFGLAAISKWYWKLHRHLAACNDRTFLARLFGREIAGRLKLDQFREELSSYSDLRKLCGKVGIPDGPQFNYDQLISADTHWFFVLYVIIRLQKPNTVIETGCASGFTSALILYALHQNQKGHLTSIDLPPRKGRFDMNWSLPEGLESGFLVPETLKNQGRWSLILGDIRYILPDILQSSALQKVDIFFHDSDHSFDHQIWEYFSVWPQMSECGLLLSDDIGWSTAFRDFIRHVDKRMVIHKSNANFGAIRK